MRPVRLPLRYTWRSWLVCAFYLLTFGVFNRDVNRLLQQHIETAGLIEVFQVVVSAHGLLYQRINLREVWLDFAGMFLARYREQPTGLLRIWCLLWDFLLIRRRWPHRDESQVTVRANLMSEVIKSTMQLGALLFGVWSLTVPPPPPENVPLILLQTFGLALLMKEGVIILFSLGLMWHSRHERHARIEIEAFPRRRRWTDRPRNGGTHPTPAPAH